MARGHGCTQMVTGMMATFLTELPLEWAPIGKQVAMSMLVRSTVSIQAVLDLKHFFS